MTGQSTRSGFTIIEVMLFLAISGLMMAGIMAVVTGGVNRQRYQDAVTSMADFMRGQYNTVDNVHTNRPTTVKCIAGSGFSGGVDQPRGTSGCTIIGRYVTTTDGRTLQSRPIFAQADITTISDDQSESEYIDALKLSTTTLYDDDNENYRVAWNTYVYTNKTNPAAHTDFTLVLIKLPTNGLIRTYATPAGGKTVAETIAAGENQQLAICVAPDGLVSSPPLGVKLLPLAANTSGVQPTTGSEGLCS